MAKKRSPSPTKEESHSWPYFVAVELGNVRCFGGDLQRLDLTDAQGRLAQWTVVLGDNGVGKTTLLQAIEACAPIEASGYSKHPTGCDFARGAYWSADEPSTSLWRHKRQRRSGRETPPDFGAAIVCGLANASFGNLPGDDRLHFSLVPNSIADVTAPRRNGPTAHTVSQGTGPFLVGYGAGRKMGPTSLAAPESLDYRKSFFSDDARLLNPEEWFLRLDYAARSELVADRARAEQSRGRVREVLLAVLPDVDDLRIQFSDRSQPCLEFHTPFGWVPLQQLSHGYKTMTCWIVDFAARLMAEYPESENPLAEPAVCLVDEIDLHLHPKWQREIRGYLCERFPKTQFIVTAHSPLIVQSASDANIAVLRREGDHVVIDNDVEQIHGWRIDQVLTSDLFGLPSARPIEVEKKLQKLSALRSKPAPSQADQAEIEQLDREIGYLPQGETASEAERLLRLAKETMELVERNRSAAP